MTRMSSLNHMDLCRLCLVKEQVSVPIFDGEGDVRQIFIKITTCLPVKMSREDRLPKKICSNCVYKVENSFEFWNTTVSAEKQLLEWLEDGSNERKIVPSSTSPSRNEETVIETEKLVLKEETLEQDQSESSKSASRVGVALRGEGTEAGADGVSEEEDEEMDESEEGEEAAGNESEESAEEDVEEPASKEEVESEEEEDEPYEELEPTTFVNVSLACDEAGPSGMQQQGEGSETKHPQSRMKTESVGPAASAPASEEPSTSSAAPSTSGSTHISVKKNTNGQHSASHEGRQDCIEPVVTVMIKTEVNIDEDFDVKWSSSLYTDEKSTAAESFFKDRFISSLDLSGKKSCLCTICGKTYANQRNLRYHLDTHNNIPVYKCHVCDMMFTSYTKLYRHKIIHRKSKDHICDVCGLSFYYKTLLDNHKVLHSKQFKLYCNICNKGFSAKCLLEEHKNVHLGKRPFTCEVCGKSFATKSNLGNHKVLHRPDYASSRRLCETCGKTVRRSYYRNHMQGHKNETYQCDICGKSITTKNSLKTHLRSHSNDKPYHCDLCDKKFASSNCLRQHRRVHTGEKPYKCEQCGKNFSQRTTLTIHLRNHTGEKPFSCDLCGKEFVCGNQRNVHRKLHHK